MAKNKQWGTASENAAVEPVGHLPLLLDGPWEYTWAFKRGVHKGRGKGYSPLLRGVSRRDGVCHRDSNPAATALKSDRANAQLFMRQSTGRGCP
jgi:hypothetical protein